MGEKGARLKSTYHRLLLQRILLILPHKGLDHVLHPFLLQRRKKRLPEERVGHCSSPSPRPFVDALPELGEVCGFGVPEAAADEALLRLAVDVVHCVRALAACAGPGGGEVRLREEC